MTECLMSQTSGNFKLEVFYENEHYEISVENVKNGDTLTEIINCNFEPLFGIDVSDMNNILQVAEKLCVKMENGDGL